MKKSIKICGVIAFLLGLVGCATLSSLQKELAAGGIPRFDGYITPITIPVLLRYKPTEFRAKGSVALSINTGRQTDEVFIEAIIESKIRKLGNLLTQDFRFEELTVNREVISIPAGFGMRALMDARGSIQEIELVGIGSHGMPEKERTEFQETFEGVKNIPLLPEMPVRSGDSFSFGSGERFDDAINKILELGEFSDLFSNNEYTVDGWGVVNGRRLLVTSIDSTITKIIEGEAMQITSNGYALWDAETAQKVEHRALMVLVTRDEPDFSMKFLTHATQF